MDLESAKAHVKLSVGGSPSYVDPGKTAAERIVDIVNDAGRQMYMRAWRFRERAKTLDVTANSRTVSLQWTESLPQFEEIVSINRTSDGSEIELVTPEEMDSRFDAADGNTGTALAMAAIGWTSSRPHLLVWPTPAATETSAIRMRFRCAWPTVAYNASDALELPIPTYVDALYLAYIRAFALGYEDDGLATRLAEVEAGPILQTALMKDGIVQRDVGRLRPQRGRRFRRRVG